MESGEQLGLCMTPDKAPAPLLFGFLTVPLFCGWLWGRERKMGQAGGHPQSAWASEKHQEAEGAVGWPLALQRKYAAWAWKGHGHTVGWGGRGGNAR